MNKERIVLFGQILLYYTLIVILWGAWVRISHSGDGCGDTWPFCQGQLIPAASQKKTWIEYTHRLMSGFYGIFVIYFYWQCRKLFNSGSLARSYSLMILIFMITEALLGAKLVLFGLVGSNSSAFRTFAMSLHQLNSLFLVGSTVAFVFTPDIEQSKTFVREFLKSLFTKNFFLIALVLVAITGAWAALSTTLFPSTNLLEGLKQDINEQSHFLLRVRMSHPLLALSLMSYYVIFFYRKSIRAELPEFLRKINLQTSFVGAAALVFGILTLLLLSPVWMKLTHLALAHTLWIMFIRQAVISLDSARR